MFSTNFFQMLILKYMTKTALGIEHKDIAIY